jgi:hypothetical protein
VTTAAGSISLAQESLRTMLADCPAFRALCGAADRGAALAHIYHEGLPPPANGSEHTAAEHAALRPWAIVYTDGRRGFQRRKESTGGFRSAGKLRLRLARSCDAADAEPTADSMLAWKNIVGQILAELCGAAIVAAAEHLAFDEIAVEDGPFAAAPTLAETQGMWQGVELAIAWGGE